MADNKIMFKRGQQAELPQSSSVAGTFYLTTDTNRLYIGKGDGLAPALLNQTVQIVSKVQDLPSSGAINDFYYCTEENVLAVCTSAGGWTQINPDTDTNHSYKLSSAEIDDTTIDTANKTVTYKIKITEDKYNLSTNTKINGDNNNITLDLVLDASDLSQILPTAAKVGLSAKETDGEITLSTKGDGSSTDSVVFAPGDNVILDIDANNKVVISSENTEYDISVIETQDETGALLRLGNKSTEAYDNVTFTAGEGIDISVTTDKVEYSHASTTRQDSTTVEETLTSDENTFTVVTGVGTNGQGHVTGVDTTKFTLPTDKYISAINQPSEFHADFVYNDTNTSISLDFSEDVGALVEDILGYISEQIGKVNSALVYKGVIDSYSALETIENDPAPVKIGDVYLLSTNDPEAGAKAGDMFIATVENSETDQDLGYITGKVVWTHIPSGDELNTDTQYYGSLVTGTNMVTYKLNPYRGGDDSGVGTTLSMSNNHKDFKLAASDGLTLSTAAGTGTTTIKHKAYSAPSSSSTDADSNTSFSAITGLTFENGHVTGVAKQTFNPIQYTVTTDTNNNIVLKDKNVTTAISTIGVSGDDSITFSAANNKLSVSHKAPGTAKTTTTATNNSTTLTPSSNFTFIDSVSYDATGHMVGATTKTLTLPADADTTYSMFLGSTSDAAGKVSAITANPWLIVRNSASVNVGKIHLNSDAKTSPIRISSSADGTEIDFCLEWGTYK